MSNKNLLKILFIEDVSSDVDLAVLELRKEKLRFEHTTVCNRVDLIEALEKLKPDLIISDYQMPSFTGLQALKLAKEIDSEIPFILCTGSVNEETAIECIKAGAQDYVIKEHMTRLPFAVKEALEQVQIQKEKRASELLLKESEEKIQSIFSAAPVGIGLVINRKYFEINDTFCRMTGYSRKEVIGKSSAMMYPTKEEFEVSGVEKYRQIAKKGIGSIETRLKCKDGRILNIISTSTPLDPEDLSKGVTFTVLDITERIHTEDELVQEKYLIYSLMDTLTDHIYFKDRSSRFIRINKSQAQFFGLSDPRQAVGKTDSDFFTGEHSKQAYEDEQTIIRTGQLLSIEERETHLNRPDTWVSTVKLPLRDKDGNIIGTFGISRDITERKLAEEALQVSQHLFQTLAQVSPVGIFRTNPDGYTTYVNPKYSELTGLSLEEAMDRGWLNAVHPDDKEKLKESWLSDYKSRKISSAEYRFLRPDGSIVWIMGNAVPEWIDNEIVGYIGTVTDITDRKSMEAVLRKSEERLRSMYNDAVVGLYRTNSQGEILLANRALINMLGFQSFEELSAINLKESGFEQPYQRQQFVDQIEKEGEIKNLESIWICRDGKKIFVRENAKAIYDSDGKILYYDGSVEDITEHKRAEKALEDERNLLRTLVDLLPTYIFVKDRESRFLMVNVACAHFMGATSTQELIGKSDAEFYQTEVAAGFKSDELGVLEGIPVVDKEEGSNSPSGIPRNLLTTKVPLRDGEGNIIGLVGASFDITELKKAEKAIRESEEKYRSIFENVQDVYFEMSIEGTILEVSPSINILSKGQYQMNDLIGKSMFDFYAEPKERQVILSELQTKGAITDFEVTLKNRDGSYTPSSISAKLILDVNQHPEKIIGSMHDITDRKNVTEALKLAKEKAEASDKLKTEFLNNISHEVRTPLNGILGFAEIMSESDLSEEDKKDSLFMLHESSNRLLNTITNYMDISLITSGSLSVHKKDFIPGKVLRRIFENFKPVCSNKHLELFLEIPEKTENLSVNSDPEILHKIISHLMNNAVKFTEKGNIGFGYTILKGELEFFVKDTGIGIGKESVDSIFKRFIKEDRGPTKITEGSGLGLSIARGMSEVIDGKIRLESEVGVGSSFFLTIPLKEAVEASFSATPEKEFSKVIDGPLILVAEDDETNFFYLNALLSREIGSKVLYASNGREAIELFKANPGINLILMDIKMPEIDGLEATRQIKLLKKDVPIIAITAYAMSGDEDKVLAAGCDSYLSKPISRKRLLEKMAEFIKIQ